MIRYTMQYYMYTNLLRNYITHTSLRQDYQCFRVGPVYNEGLVNLVFIEERLYTMILKYGEYL